MLCSMATRSNGCGNCPGDVKEVRHNRVPHISRFSRWGSGSRGGARSWSRPCVPVLEEGRGIFISTYTRTAPAFAKCAKGWATRPGAPHLAIFEKWGSTTHTCRCELRHRSGAFRCKAARSLGIKQPTHISKTARCGAPDHVFAMPEECRDPSLAGLRVAKACASSG
jgi:hypothetical protein